MAKTNKSSKLIISVPLALDAQVSDEFGNGAQAIAPPTLMVEVDREAYERNPQYFMAEIYKRADRIMGIERRKGRNIIERLSERGYIKNA